MEQQLSVETEHDQTSYLVDLSKRDLHGFCKDLTLRRHKDEAISNDAIDEARKDWHSWIGPIDTFANANPYDGNFTALTLPYTKKERLAVCSYFMEYAFLYDDVNESAAKALSMTNDTIINDPRSAQGAKKMQHKIIQELFRIDPAGGQRILDTWKICVSSVREQKQSSQFNNLEEYVIFRGAECGAPFVEALMLFGMGIRLSPEDDELLQTVKEPAYATLGLANDYFSFDREFAEQDAPEPITNAVYLCTQWERIEIREAKEMVRREAVRYEDEFVRRKWAFQGNEVQRMCLEGLEQMIVGNVVWSLRCPRYHPKMRYDANKGAESGFLGREGVTVNAVWQACGEKEE